jgi:hypothetical protein
MFERLVRSWSLIKGSAAIVRDNKSLLLFPVVSGIATIVIVVSFLLPLLGVEDFDVSSSQDETIVYVWFALLYFALYFVSIFFNAALVSVALLRLSGSPATLGDGFARAAGRLPAILGYALLAASVGILLRVIEERVGWIGRITAGIIGVTWTVATFLAVPCLAARDIGPLEALSESATLLKRTWGENIAGNVGISFVFSLGYFAIISGTIALMVAAPAGQAALLASIFMAGVVILLATVVLHSTLQGVYAAAVYCYATLGETAVPGLSAEALSGAFRTRNR